MTPLQLFARLDRLQRALRGVAAGTIAAWSLSTVALVLALGVVLRMSLGKPAIGVMWIAAVMIGVGVGAWRWRVQSPAKVQRLDAALWAEAQAPELRYALVTLAEQERASDADPLQRRLAHFTTAVGWEPVVDGALRQRRLQVAGRIAAALIVIALAASPWPVRAATALGAPVRTVIADSTAALPGRVRAEVVLLPPGYTGRSERSLAFGETVSALVGSIIRIDGAGALDRATLLVQESSDSGAAAARTVARAPRADGWRGDVRIGSAPLALRLRDAVGERWLLITPVMDSAPVATLQLPAADTLVFDSTAKIALSGTIHDDIGLRDARIEYIISSGGGEQFTFKSGAMQERRGALGRDITCAPRSTWVRWV